MNQGNTNVERFFLPTYSGKRVDPANADFDQICWLDISHGLARQCRYAGQTRRHYSVAEHCVRMSRVCSPENKKWAIGHDAPEAYCIDLPRPIKMQSNLRKIYGELENGIYLKICEKYGMDPKIPEEIKLLDEAILYVELPLMFLKDSALRNCMSAAPQEMIDKLQAGFDSDDWGWPYERARDEYLKVVYDCGWSVD